MAEEENGVPAGGQPEFGAQDYLDNLSALKDTMVSKDEYNRILEDNRKMANALASGLNYGEEKPEPADINKLRESLFSPDKQRKTNLQYFTEVLALRDALIEAGEPDPFLPYNREYVPTQQDIADVERIAENLKECVESAKGDPGIFNVELQRRCGYKKRG